MQHVAQPWMPGACFCLGLRAERSGQCGGILAIQPWTTRVGISVHQVAGMEELPSLIVRWYRAKGPLLGRLGGPSNEEPGSLGTWKGEGMIVAKASQLSARTCRDGCRNSRRSVRFPRLAVLF